MNRPGWYKETRAHLVRLAILMLGAALLGGAFIAAYPDYVYAAGNVPITRTFQSSTRHSYIDQEQPTKNYGTNTEVYVRACPSKAWRILVYFDLSQIPSGSTVTAATLYLYLKIQD